MESGGNLDAILRIFTKYKIHKRAGAARQDPRSMNDGVAPVMLRLNDKINPML